MSLTDISSGASIWCDMMTWEDMLQYVCICCNMSRHVQWNSEDTVTARRHVATCLKTLPTKMTPTQPNPTLISLPFHHHWSEPHIAASHLCPTSSFPSTTSVSKVWSLLAVLLHAQWVHQHPSMWLLDHCLFLTIFGWFHRSIPTRWLHAVILRIRRSRKLSCYAIGVAVGRLVSHVSPASSKRGSFLSSCCRSHSPPISSPNSSMRIRHTERSKPTTLARSPANCGQSATNYNTEFVHWVQPQCPLCFCFALRNFSFIVQTFVKWLWLQQPNVFCDFLLYTRWISVCSMSCCSGTKSTSWEIVSGGGFFILVKLEIAQRLFSPWGLWPGYIFQCW